MNGDWPPRSRSRWIFAIKYPLSFENSSGKAFPWQRRIVLPLGLLVDLHDALCGQIADALLSARLPSVEAVSTERLQIVDGRISHAGADETSWQLHAAYDPATAYFTDLELTDPDAGEGFARLAFSQGDLVVEDRG